MHSTQTQFRLPLPHDQSSPNTPIQLPNNDNEIHHYPNSVRKSIKLQHRTRIGFHRRSKAGSDITEQKKQQYRLSAQINMNCMLTQNKLSILHENKHFSQSPTKLPEQFETTADRMLNLRRKLAPVRKQREEKRYIISIDKTRNSAVQRATFLNIEKVELVKMYSNSERKEDSSRSIETAQERYVFSPPPLSYKKESAQINMSQLVVDFRKTMKEASAARWNSTKPRIKPFITPFERYYYKDFVWKVAFSNGFLLTALPEQMKVKVFVGRGNNSQLVRSLIKRRSWWTFTQKWQEANLVWTQLKVSNYFALQSASNNQHKIIGCELSKQKYQRNEFNLKIMNENDVNIWDYYWRQNRPIENKMNEDMSKRTNHFKRQNLGLTQVNIKNLRMQNHMSQNFIIGNKKALLYTMRQYYESNNMNVFDYLPLSFHVTKGMDDPQYTKFLGHYFERRKKSKKEGTSNIWIVKPGELTNRGNGIIVCLTLQQIRGLIKKGGKHFDGTPKTFILQQYIQRPFLYQRRKFDIRHFILVTSINGRFKGYWFKRGYLRTSSSEYTLNHGQSSVHLTNDAVQKYLPDYGRYQKGNKVSYEDFQTYLNREYQGRYDFFEDIYPKLKNMATDVIRASAKKLDPHNREHNFEIFGLDFMIDSAFQPWLIECNSNPCLQICCPLQKSMIPALIENTLKICVDSMVGPPADFPQKRPRFMDNVLANNQFQMVYDSVLEDDRSEQEIGCEGLNMAELDNQEDEQFEDDGEALED